MSDIGMLVEDSSKNRPFSTQQESQQELLQKDFNVEVGSDLSERPCR
jgi:hypothetical protein